MVRSYKRKTEKRTIDNLILALQAIDQGMSANAASQASSKYHAQLCVVIETSIFQQKQHQL